MILKKLLSLAENGKVNDFFLRFGIRSLLRYRLYCEKSSDVSNEINKLQEFISSVTKEVIAKDQDAANEQHYMIPSAFYDKCLGPRKKYSSCVWEGTTTNLEDAEIKSLKQICERAEIVDGQEILELGCGWGSLTLWLGENYPKSQITALSNSSSQREYILSKAREKSLNNINVITADIANYNDTKQYDRIVSIEMFEHVRNHKALLKKISTWLKNNGQLFVHIFSHAKYAYLFETEGDDNWMGRYFFTGGMMPSDSLFLYYQDDLTIKKHWRLNGKNYGKTADAWLENIDKNKETVLPVLKEIYGENQEIIWFNRWRIFFLACSELFAFRNGNEWFVSHYLFRRK